MSQDFLCTLQWQEKHISYNFDVRQGKIFSEFFKGGQTNVCYNCLDRHIKEGRGDQTCFIWEGNDLDRDRKMTYQEALNEVCRVVRACLLLVATFFVSVQCDRTEAACNTAVQMSWHGLYPYVSRVGAFTARVGPQCISV